VFMLSVMQELTISFSVEGVNVPSSVVELANSPMIWLLGGDNLGLEVLWSVGSKGFEVPFFEYSVPDHISCLCWSLRT
jgi:hypothetical protein